MTFSKILASTVACSLILTAASARADEGFSRPTGLMLQTRLEAGGSILSALGLSGSGLAIGYQGPSFALALSGGLMRLGASDEDDQSLSGTAFQLAPMAFIDVWRSADGRARANMVGSVGYGRMAVSVDGQSCTFDPQTGEDVCSPSNTTTRASIIPFRLGLGGDYAIGRNFALGLEGGLNFAFVSGLESETDGTTRAIDSTFNWQVTYALLRATFVIGD
jgi:hypothetical protein